MPPDARSALNSENDATTRPMDPKSPNGHDPVLKARSCIVCRNRKVRCDKQVPCSNCRRANIACLFPSAERPPRWVRRLDRLTEEPGQSSAPSSSSVRPSLTVAMDRLHNLEHLVRELRGQLEQAQASAVTSDGGADRGGNVTESQVEHARDAPSPYGRLVLQDGANESHYVGSAFWSRIVDELEGLKIDTAGLATDDNGSDTTDSASERTEDPATTGQLQQPSTKPSAFIFQQSSGLSKLEVRRLHPSPLEVPFLLDTFAENVNMLSRGVQMSEVTHLARKVRSTGTDNLSPSQEALLFSIYYAAVASMEDDDVEAHLGRSKRDLIARYRSGLEYAFTAANFLANPDITLVQAFAIFISLARRHESPRYVYMLTALLVRMAQYLGLHRDGSHLGHLTPYEIHLRRRVWWMVCKLDTRAAEDQGTDLAIPMGSFDTKPPLNINESDLTPDSTSWPPERQGITDMTFARIIAGVMQIHRDLMTRLAPSSTSSASTPADLDARSKLVGNVLSEFEHGYLQHANPAHDLLYWVCNNVARLVMAKLLLLSFLPILFVSPPTATSPPTTTTHTTASPTTPQPLQHTLQLAALEVTEYNHALNASAAARPWRWIFQTHTHWYAVVYLMLALARRDRPWGPLSERGYVALRSEWLFPGGGLQGLRGAKGVGFGGGDRGMGRGGSQEIWVPLRKLMGQVRRHRAAEVRRLRGDEAAAERLVREDARWKAPGSPGAVEGGGRGGEESRRVFVERWRGLIAGREDETGGGGEGTAADGGPAGGIGSGSRSGRMHLDETRTRVHGQGKADRLAHLPGHQVYSAVSTAQTAYHPAVPTAAHVPEQQPHHPGAPLAGFGRTAQSTYFWPEPATNAPLPAATEEFSMFDDFVDVSFDAGMDATAVADVNWYSLVESAQGMHSVGDEGWTGTG